MGNNLHNADIYVVGTGLFDLDQVTLETLDVLRGAALVLHVSSKHALLCRINPHTEDINSLYWKRGRVGRIYRGIARLVVDRALRVRPVVFAVDGNPMFCNDISWEIARFGKQKKLHVQVLPSVSCLDVLPIQLGFDIADLGAQVFEATQLVMFNLRMNPFVSTLIVQVAEFGERSVFIRNSSSARLDRLVSHLLKYYPAKHTVVFIRSACDSKETTTAFSSEVRAIKQNIDRIQVGMSLYVPRVRIPDVRRDWLW